MNDAYDDDDRLELFLFDKDGRQVLAMDVGGEAPEWVMHTVEHGHMEPTVELAVINGNEPDMNKFTDIIVMSRLEESDGVVLMQLSPQFGAKLAVSLLHSLPQSVIAEALLATQGSNPSFEQVLVGVPDDIGELDTTNDG